MIEINERFDVPAPPATVWRVLSDPRAVVGCVPGAVLGADLGDGEFEASLTVRLGPTRVAFNARVRLELDEPAHTGRLTATGRDSQGGTRMSATSAFRVLPAPAVDGSGVVITGQVEIGGRLAMLIEGGAGVVVKRMSGEFAQALAARCAAEAASRS